MEDDDGESEKPLWDIALERILTRFSRLPKSHAVLATTIIMMAAEEPHPGKRREAALRLSEILFPEHHPKKAP